MANNFRRLKEEADIEQVVTYLGLETHSKGTAIFIFCPHPDHNDTHATNCYFKRGWNNVHCRVCQKSFLAIDLMMWSLQISYGEAADLLYELEGCPEWYHDNSWKDNRKKQAFYISYNEANLLGIQLSKTLEIPYSYSTNRKYLSDEIPKGYGYSAKETDGYLLCKKQLTTWKDWLTEDEMKHLVQEKAREKLQLFDKLDDFFGDPIYSKERQLIHGILQRCL